MQRRAKWRPSRSWFIRETQSVNGVDLEVQRRIPFKFTILNRSVEEEQIHQKTVSFFAVIVIGLFTE
jgi:hypothetical protein